MNWRRLPRPDSIGARNDWVAVIASPDTTPVGRRSNLFLAPAGRLVMFKGPALTVDAVILTEKNEVVLVRRKHEPFAGLWALPGGFVEYGERVEDAMRREIAEETGLVVELVKLVGVYSDPERDPRGHTVTLAYLCRITGGQLHSGDDAADARAFPLPLAPEVRLAFDHSHILSDALRL